MWRNKQLTMQKNTNSRTCTCLNKLAWLWKAGKGVHLSYFDQEKNRIMKKALLPTCIWILSICFQPLLGQKVSMPFDSDHWTHNARAIMVDGFMGYEKAVLLQGGQMYLPDVSFLPISPYWKGWTLGLAIGYGSIATDRWFIPEMQDSGPEITGFWVTSVFLMV